ncbi:hypothetical protein MASR2M78_34630 [Treponema sp.]
MHDKVDNTTYRRRAGLYLMHFLAFCLAINASLLCISCVRLDQKTIILQVWDFKYGEAVMGDVMREIDRAFEEQHPGLRIEHRALSDVDDDAVLAAAIAANAAPDVVMVHAGAELRSVEQDLRSMDSELAPHMARLLSETIAACRGSDGSIRAIPLTVQGFGWYYNKNLFKEAGIDPEKEMRNWNDFLATCETLRRAGILPIAWGNNPAHGSDWLRRGLASTFYSDKELRSLFASPAFADDPRFIRISSMIRELRDRDYLDSTGAFRDHITDASALFASGKAAMFYGLLSDIANWKVFSDTLGPSNVGFFPSINDKEAPRKDRMGLQGAGIVYAVLGTSPNPDLAAAYALSYLQEDTASLLIERVGALSPLRNVQYPTKKYPVLGKIFEAMNVGGDDMELYYPNLALRDALFRYDELFINTKEIDITAYRKALKAEAEAILRP